MSSLFKCLFSSFKLDEDTIAKRFQGWEEMNKLKQKAIEDEMAAEATKVEGMGKVYTLVSFFNSSLNLFQRVVSLLTRWFHRYRPLHITSSNSPRRSFFTTVAGREDWVQVLVWH